MSKPVLTCFTGFEQVSREDLLGFSTIDLEQRFYAIVRCLDVLAADLSQWRDMFIDAFVHAIAAKWEETNKVIGSG